MAPTGDFECSDTLINRLQDNIQWSLRGNFLDIPTDCPQRDERMGWTGDAQIFAPTACFNMDTSSFYSKWMKDFRVDQKEDGSIPWVVPNVIEDGAGTGWSDGYGATGWADAVVIIPWTVYQVYGDKRILSELYTTMRGWEEYMIRESGDSYIFRTGFHFGDWLSFAEYFTYRYNAPDYGYAGATTEKELIATAYFYYTTGLMHKIAVILGNKDDAERYGDLLPRIKKAFQDEFLTKNGRLTSNTQTAYVLALSFGLLPGDLVDIAAKRLADDINYFGHLTTGFLGTPLLCQALTNNGFSDIAYKLLFNKRYPSWLYPVTEGATTIWERWDGIRPDGSFQDQRMNSFNHYAYGAVGSWLYSSVAGIRFDEENPGYKRIIIKPYLTDKLDYAKAVFHSVYGRIVSHWKRCNDSIKFHVEIPPNTTACIYIPCSEKKQIYDSNKRVEELKEVKILGWQGGITILEIGSGKYVFEFDADF
jgi:alpha-L-rhamnosidase